MGGSKRGRSDPSGRKEHKKAKRDTFSSDSDNEELYIVERVEGRKVVKVRFDVSTRY